MRALMLVEVKFGPEYDELNSAEQQEIRYAVLDGLFSVDVEEALQKELNDWYTADMVLMCEVWDAKQTRKQTLKNA